MTHELEGYRGLLSFGSRSKQQRTRSPHKVSIRVFPQPTREALEAMAGGSRAIQTALMARLARAALFGLVETR